MIKSFVREKLSKGVYKVEIRVQERSSKDQHESVAPYIEIPSKLSLKASKEALEKGLRSSEWTYACVTKIATACSKVRLRVELEGDLADPLDTVSRLISLPSRRDKLNQSRLLYIWAQHLALDGAIFGKLNGALRSYSISVLPPKIARPFTREGELGFEYLSGKEWKELEKDKVVFGNRPNYLNSLKSTTPLIDCNDLFEIVSATRNWNRTALNNRSVADGYFYNDSHMTEAQYAEQRRRLYHQVGGHGRARTVLFFTGGTKWQSMVPSSVDVDYIPSTKLNREAICAVFGVPPVMVGILENATYSNFFQAERVLGNTVSYYMNTICQSLTETVKTNFGDGYTVTFEMSDVPGVSTITKEESEVARNFVEMGVPFTEVNRRMGLRFNRFDNDDKPLRAAGLVDPTFELVDEEMG